MELHVTLVGRRDLPSQIYRSLRDAILDGRLRDGDRLPATRELAIHLGVSRTTVALAYERLTDEGYVRARIGSGTFAISKAVPTHSDHRRTSRGPQPRSVWRSIPLPSDSARKVEFDFRVGIPDARLFPHERWRRSVARELRADAIGSGGYDDPAGHLGLREAICRHIGMSRGIRALAENVVITNGAQQAVDVIGRVLLGPGDRVAVEDPGHPSLRWLFTGLGARVTGVSVDEEGLDVDGIPSGARLIHVSPSHQMPLGVSMSLARRKALLNWAEEHGAAIIEDDYDSEFRFGRPGIDALQTLDTGDRVIYVGSFSKTMLPTLRLGFVIVPDSLRTASVAAKYLTDRHTSKPLQAALATFIDDGLLAQHVRRMRAVYQARRNLMLASLDRMFAGELEVVPSSVGLHFGTRAVTATADRVDEVVRRASVSGVECHALSAFAASDRTRPGLVLGYGAIETERIQDGMLRLRDAFGA